MTDYTALIKGDQLSKFMADYGDDAYFFVYAYIRGELRMIAMNTKFKLILTLCTSILSSAIISAKLIDDKFDVIIDLDKEGR